MDINWWNVSGIVLNIIGVIGVGLTTHALSGLGTGDFLGPTKIMGVLVSLFNAVMSGLGLRTYTIYWYCWMLIISGFLLQLIGQFAK